MSSKDPSSRSLHVFKEFISRRSFWEPDFLEDRGLQSTTGLLGEEAADFQTLEPHEAETQERDLRKSDIQKRILQRLPRGARLPEAWFPRARLPRRQGLVSKPLPLTSLTSGKPAFEEFTFLETASRLEAHDFQQPSPLESRSLPRRARVPRRHSTAIRELASQESDFLGGQKFDFSEGKSLVSFKDKGLIAWRTRT